MTIRGDRYRDALVVANAVDTVRSLEPDMILYGHHDPVVGRELIQEELNALHGAILYVHDETVKGMNEGKSVHELMSEISLPPALEVGEGYGKVSWSVRAIWENYGGWFHHQSTTELYSVPASQVHTDVVALAGADALLERARSKRKARKLEEALHLVYMVLNAEPQHCEALTLSQTIHKDLLGQTDNFWLRSWLNHQINTLQTQINEIS